jgi:hypothetical protein
MIEELIGFDTRLKAEDYLDRAWTHEKRSMHLLNSEIFWPLSVDLMVWPSIFKYSSTQVGPIRINMDGLIDVESISTRHSALVLWPSLADMNNCLGSSQINLCGIKIAITLHAEKEALSNEYWRAVLYPPLSINDLPKDWRLIGHDIADHDMISGLSNCGYNAEDAASLRNIWKSRINEHGLFDSFDDAMAFKDLTEKRVPSHSPFYIYSLFREP